MMKIKNIKKIAHKRGSSLSYHFRKNRSKYKDKYLESLSNYTFTDRNGCIINSLVSEVELLSIDIYDVVLNNIFTDIDYYSIVDKVPLWIRNTGNSAESISSKKKFEQLCKNNNNYLTNKLLYYHDLEKMISSFQDRYSMIEPLLDRLYNIITPNLELDIKDFDSVTVFRDTSCYEAHSCLNSIFIYLGSGFDLLTKIAYELKFMNSINFTSYPKLNSKNILFGQRSQLAHELKNNTIFAYPIIVKKIQSIRDEIIHNGSLDFQLDIYMGIKRQKKDEYWIYLPDFTESGTLVSSINRNKFYSNTNQKVNNVLPEMLIEVFPLIISTLNAIKKTYSKPYFENKDDICKFKKEINNWIT